MDKSSLKLLKVILKYPKNFLGGYASLHTVCGTAPSVVFDLQVDVPTTFFFFLPWFLAEERTQQPTRQNPYRTHWLIVGKCHNVAFLSPSVCAAKKALRLFHRWGKKPLVRAKPKGFSFSVHLWGLIFSAYRFVTIMAMRVSVNLCVFWCFRCSDVK